MTTLSYVNYPGPGDYAPQDDPNGDVYETDDVRELETKLAYCTLDPEDLVGVPPWKRLRWSIAMDYRAKLIRERINELAQLSDLLREARLRGIPTKDGDVTLPPEGEWI
jgi:hypothetical protein